MKSYGQFCPIAKASELFCERWTPLVIRNLAAGACRFTAIHRGVPHMSATLLSSRLKLLEAEGLVERRRSASGNTWTYHLTEAGQDFVPMVSLLGRWGRRWTRRTLAEGELDIGLLIWGLEHCVDPAAFGPDRVVVCLTFTDQPSHKATYWFVNEAGRLDLCVNDPGFDVALWLGATLRDLTHVYRGDVPIAVALGDGRLEAHGPRDLVARLGAWFNLGPLNDVAPAPGAPVTRF